MTSNTSNTSSVQPPVEPITIEDLKRGAEHVGDLASGISRRVAERVAEQTATRRMLAAAAVVVITAGLAYYYGRRTRGVL
jgi:hypothetical protein